MARFTRATVLVVVCAAALPVFIVAQGAGTADWPHWRGAASDGKATTADARLARPFALRLRWTRTLGAGYSGIAVADGHAVTMFSDGVRDFLVSLDARTGRDEWRVDVGDAFPGRDGSAGGPVSTPAIDRGVAYGLGPHGLLVAVTLADGTLLWKRQLVTELGAAEPHWGFTASPLVAGDLVVVLTGGNRSAAITAFDRRTGATVWQAGTGITSYQSPMLARVAGEERIVAGSDETLFAVDPASGREVWRYAHGGRGFYARIINPVALGDDELLLTYRPDASIMLRTSAAPLAGWTTRELKLNYASPVVHDGLVFGYSGAFLSCIDAASGVLRWRSREPGDGFPIVVDGHLVVLTKDGRISIAPASAAGFAERAALQVFERLVWTPPSFAGGTIYARDSYETVAAVEIVPSTSTTDTPEGTEGIIAGSAFARWVESVERSEDPEAQVTTWLAARKPFPIVEGRDTVHLVYRGDVKDPVVVGDMLETGRSLPLRRVRGTDLYYASFRIAPDARIGYQFVHDLDQTTADPNNPRRATSLNYAGDTSVLLMPEAAPMMAIPDAPLRGRIEELEVNSTTVTSNHLTWGGTRAVHVYLPPGRDADAARRFPTVYVLYGEQMLKEARLAQAVDREIGKTLPPAVVVFVDSTNPYEYARTFREAHMRMLEREVVPLVDARFRTDARAASRAIVGVDEAGFAAVETALRMPATFGGVVAHSLFPLSAGGDELLALVERTPPSAQRFHVDWGRYDPHRRTDKLDVAAFSKSVNARLAARGFSVSGGEWADGSLLPLVTERTLLALRGILGPAARH